MRTTTLGFLTLFGLALGASSLAHAAEGTPRQRALRGAPLKAELAARVDRANTAFAALRPEADRFVVFRAITDHPTHTWTVPQYCAAYRDDFLVAKAALSRLGEIYEGDRQALLKQVPWYSLVGRRQVNRTYDALASRVKQAEGCFTARVASFKNQAGLAELMVWSTVSTILDARPDVPDALLLSQVRTNLRALSGM